ncbi:hypothetical protein [Streptomyces sp. NPDC088730]|uniref:hypothetical protein n=1 Tax=Streptomyces sp. NPDC088730 TaxID=3365877 RepID=UPI00382CF706
MRRLLQVPGPDPSTVYQDLRRYVRDNSDTATLKDARGHKADSKSCGRHHGGRR